MKALDSADHAWALFSFFSLTVDKQKEILDRWALQVDQAVYIVKGTVLLWLLRALREVAPAFMEQFTDNAGACRTVAALILKLDSMLIERMAVDSIIDIKSGEWEAITAHCTLCLRQVRLPVIELNSLPSLGDMLEIESYR